LLSLTFLQQLLFKPRSETEEERERERKRARGKKRKRERRSEKKRIKSTSQNNIHLSIELNTYIVSRSCLQQEKR